MESKKQLFITTGVIVVIIIGAFAFNASTPRVSEDGGETIAHMSQNNRKAEVLRRVNSTEPLTQSEKDTLLEVLSGEQIKEYGFTPEERAKILEALNRPTAN